MGWLFVDVSAEGPLSGDCSYVGGGGASCAITNWGRAADIKYSDSRSAKLDLTRRNRKNSYSNRPLLKLDIVLNPPVRLSYLCYLGFSYIEMQNRRYGL